MPLNLPSPEISFMNLTSTSADLSTMLSILVKYGKPSLYHMGDGWYCSIDMFVSSKGAEFKVKSDFKKPTPESAVDECLKRVLQTLKDLGV